MRQDVGRGGRGDGGTALETPGSSMARTDLVRIFDDHFDFFVLDLNGFTRTPDGGDDVHILRLVMIEPITRRRGSIIEFFFFFFLLLLIPEPFVFVTVAVAPIVSSCGVIGGTGGRGREGHRRRAARRGRRHNTARYFLGSVQQMIPGGHHGRD